MSAQEQILNKLIRFQRKKLNYLVLSGFINFIIYSLIIWLSTFVADSVFYFTTAVRWFTLIFNGSLTFYFLYYLVISPLTQYLTLSPQNDLTNIAREIGGLFPTISDKLTNIYQLITADPSGSSLEIRDHAIKRFADRIKELGFIEKIEFKNYLLPVIIILPVLIGSFILLYSGGEKISLSMQRILNPAGNFAIIPEYEFIVQPGDTEIISGTSVEITASFTGPKIEKCILTYYYDDKIHHTIPMRTEGNHFSLKLDRIKRNIQYYVKVIPTMPSEWQEKLISKIYTIKTLIPPYVSELQVKVMPPAYTNLPEKLLDLNVGDIIAYPGSRVNISGRSNKILKHSEIVFLDDKRENCRIRENKFNYSFIVKENHSYHFRLIDRDDIGNLNPIQYHITQLVDQYPIVEITEPGGDVEIPTDGSLNLQIEGRDDFGFGRLYLHYQIIGKIKELTDSTWHQFTIPLNSFNNTYIKQNFYWNFENFPVSFDDAIKYYASIRDNDNVNGPKKGQSGTYYIYFPSLDQLFSEFDLTQNEQLEATEDLAEESEDIKKELEDISREMKREKEIDWERKRSIESVLEKQEQMEEKLQKIDRELEQAIDKMEKNQLFSPEILEKYHQLQSLFQEISTPELLQAMQNLRSSLEKMNQRQTQQSVEKVKINQEQFKENLERTLALFEKVKLQQELDRLVKMSETLSYEQQKISNELEKEEFLNSKEKQSLSHKQRMQKNLMTQLNESISNIMKNSLMREYPQTNDHLGDASAHGVKVEDQINKTFEDLVAGEMVEASSGSGKLEQEMNELHADLVRAQQSMLNQDRQKIMSKMKKVTDNLLKLSAEEEKIVDDTKKLSNYSDRFPEIASSQQQIIENLSHVTKDIIDLSHETFFLQPQMSKALGSAFGNMKKSITELENRSHHSAAKFQSQAMAGINKSIMQMQQSMKNMSSAKSALGFEEYLQELQKLCKCQGKINQQSLELFNRNRGTLSLQQQQALQRMAAEQKAIQESLENLSQKTENRSDLLGRMGQISKDMEEVAEEMQSLNLDRKTIERQQKILSRMLDAQKSVREREYSKKRIAIVGKQYVRRSPGKPTDMENEKLKKLKLDLIRALQEGYNPDYENLIEAYFQNLNENIIR